MWDDRKETVKDMKYKIIAAALLALSLCLCACSKDGENAETTKSMSEHPENGVHYVYSDGGNSDRVSQSITYENGKEIYRNDYDYWDNGKLKSITTTVDGEQTDVWYYNYSESGVLSQMVREYTEEGVECRDDYRYNEDCTMSEESRYKDGSFMGGYRYSYNENGDTTLEEQLDANGDVITYTEYSFDEEGRTAKSANYMYGSIVGKGVYEYGQTGELLGIKYYDSKDSITSEVRNEYDEKGNLVKILNCDSDGTVLNYTECLYDENGFNYRDIYYQNGTPLYCYDYTEDGARIYSAYN